MAKSQIINIIVNKYSLNREWLNQFQTNDLQNMLKEFDEKIGK